MYKLLKYVAAICLTITLMGFNDTASAQTAPEGIDFFHGSWAEGLAKAKAEKKLIFVDAYAVWCGPCKWMAANTFTDKLVGDYFNKHFVNFKMDMEKGEGRDLARNWGIRAYPTLLFFDSNAGEVHRSMGAKPAADFLKLGETVIAKKQGS